MNRYGNAIYLTPMVLGAMVSVLAAAWRFLGVHRGETTETAWDALGAMPGRVRKTDSEAELKQ
jgi:hypothetical protein